MHIIGLEIGVKRAIRAYLVEMGSSEASAEQLANEKLADGIAVFDQALHASDNDSFDMQMASAFASLRTWVRGNDDPDPFTPISAEDRVHAALTAHHVEQGLSAEQAAALSSSLMNEHAWAQHYNDASGGEPGVEAAFEFLRNQ